MLFSIVYKFINNSLYSSVFVSKKTATLHSSQETKPQSNRYLKLIFHQTNVKKYVYHFVVCYIDLNILFSIVYKFINKSIYSSVFVSKKTPTLHSTQETKPRNNRYFKLIFHQTNVKKYVYHFVVCYIDFFKDIFPNSCKTPRER